MLAVAHELGELSGDGRCVVQLGEAWLHRDGLGRVGAHEEDEGTGDE